MRILITGAKGMFGRTLLASLAGRHDCLGVDVDDFDLADSLATRSAVAAAHPQVVVHCAAMTAVDRCETEADLAFRVNALGSANLALASHLAGARIVALSTDYVFPGTLDRPYHEWDAVGPKSIYGASKLAGEQAVVAHNPNHTIVRIAWLYGAGGPSFVHTMLKLGAEAGPPLKVVADQIGNPTSCEAVASAIERLLDTPIPGVVHATCEGEATWFQFAQEIFRLGNCRRELVPCTTAEYPRPAPRPANSRLEKRVMRLAGLPSMPHWQEALAEFFASHH